MRAKKEQAKEPSMFRKGTSLAGTSARGKRMTEGRGRRMEAVSQTAQ